MRGRMTAVAVAAGAVLLVTGCGQLPATAVLHAADASDAPAAAPLPDGCLGPGLDLALGFGAYAVPLAGTAASADELPSWESAALQMAPATAVSAADGPFTLCSYVADHPSPFSTRGGEDKLVCVLVDAAGRASLVDVRTVASGTGSLACTPTAEG